MLSLISCSLSCDSKYPAFLTRKTTGALYTFSPGLPQNEGVFPGSGFVVLPNRSAGSVQCHSQRSLLRSSKLRKCPGTVLFGADISNGELMPCGKIRSKTNAASRAQQLLFSLFPIMDRSSSTKLTETTLLGEDRGEQ